MASPYIPEEIRQRVRAAFRDRCAYCLSAQAYVLGMLEVEHIIPRVRGGGNEEGNLCLACRLCNLYKRDQVEAIDLVSNILTGLFNPRAQVWGDHFQWSQDGVKVIGITPTGRATVVALHLNNEIAENVRRNWVIVGWHPPDQ